MINNYPFNFEENDSDSYFESRITVSSYARFLNASPGTPSVDVYLNGKLTAKNLTYEKFTDYMKLSSGNYDIKVYAAGKKDKVFVDTKIEIPTGSTQTISIIGKNPRLSVYPILEPMPQTKSYQPLVRFINLSPDSPELDLAIKNDGTLFKNVAYKEISGYKGLVPKTYGLEVKDSRTKKVLLSLGNIRFLPNKIYSVYIVGLVNGKPYIQGLIPLDGTTYLK